MRDRRWQIGTVVALLAPLGLARGETVDKYYPGDAQVVVTVNVRQILGSALMKKDLGKIRDQLKEVEEAQKVLEDLGFDPFKDLESVSVAAAGASDTDKLLFVIHGKFNVAKFKAKGEEAIKEAADILAIEKDGDHTLYKVTVPGQEKPLYIGVLDGTTIVGSPTKDAVKDAFAVQAGKKKHTLKKDLQDLLQKAPATHSIVMVGLGSALPSLPQTESIKNLVGWINMTDEIQAQFDILADGESAAKELAKTIEDGIDQGKNFLNIIAMQQEALAPLTGLLDVLKVSEKGKTVTIKGRVTKEAIQKLEKKP